MLMKLRGKMRNQKGFTLVELMAVVVIIGVLIAIAVPVYSNIQEGAKVRADEASLRSLNAAATAWAMDQNPIVDLTTVSDMTVVKLKTGGKYIKEDFAEQPQSKTYSAYTWTQTKGAFVLTPASGSGGETP